MNVLGIDTGFASYGWGIVDLTTEGERVVAAGCIRTKKSKRKVLITADNFRRGAEIERELERVIAVHDPKAIAIEAMSWPRSSSVVAKLGIAWGITIAVATRHDFPVVSSSPQELKKRLTGKASSSKEEMRAAVLKTTGCIRLAGMLAKVLPASEHEHPIDAVAAVIAARDTDVMRTIRQLGRTT